MKLCLFHAKPASNGISVLGILLLALLSTNAYAMWVGMSDAQLIKQSNLVVKATYIGATTLTLNKKKYHLGALSIEGTLKGDMQDVVFIRLSSRPKGSPKRSDEISFKPGQQGVWFLEKIIEQEGIYEINRPDRFIPAEQLKNRLPAILKLID